MPSEGLLLLAVVTMTTTLGLLAARWAIERTRRRLPEDHEGGVEALARLHRVRTWIALAMALGPLAFGHFGALHGAWERHVLLAVLASLFAFDAGTLRPLLRLQGVRRPAGWSEDRAAAMPRFALATQFAIPLLAASGVAIVGAVTPVGAPADLPFIGHALGVVAGWWVIGRAFRAIGRPERLPDLHALPLRAALGDALPQLYVWRAEGEGTWNAMAVGLRRGRRSVLVSEDLLRLLPPSEVQAILWHEVGHHARRHLLVRTALAFLGWVVLPFVLAPLGQLTPTTSLLCALAGVLPFGALYRVQERQADAYAARHAPAADLGAALLRMARAHRMPMDTRLASSHPAMRRRLLDLGLPATFETETLPPTG